MKRSTLRMFRMFLVGLLLFGLAARSSFADPTNTAPPSVTVTPVGQYISVRGDENQFRADHWGKDGWSGGIEDMTFSQKLNKDWQLNFQGRAIFDDNDYKLRLEILNPDVGFVRAGFTEFRSYYDDNGGFFKSFSPSSLSLDKDMFLRRGSFYFEAGLTLPNVPKLTLGYERQFRNGSESLLQWGPVTQGTTTKNIFPAFQNVDESTDIVRLGIEHHVGSVQMANDFRYEHFRSDNKRFDGATNLVSGAGKTVEIHEDYNHDQFFNTFRMDQHLNEKVYWSLGYLFTTLDGNGDLTLNTQPFNTPFDKDWTTRVIDVNQDSHVVNVNTMFGPFAGLSISAGLQAESTTGDGFTDATLTELAGGGVTNSPRALLHSSTDKSSLEEMLGVRYTKIPFTTLYAEGRLTEQQIDLSERETLDAAPEFSRKTDTEVFRQEYVVGFNTAPVPRVTLAGRYRHTSTDNDYENHVDTMPGYPAFITAQDFITDELTAKLTLRPSRSLNLAFKYQLVSTEIKTTTDSVPLLAPGGRIQSGNYDAAIYSVSATVTPISRLYVTGLFSFTDTHTITPANGNASLINYAGNVYTLMGTSGYALDNKTDLNVEYTYSRTDNFKDNSADGLPLGLDSQRTSVLVGLSRRLCKNATVRLRYGFYEYNDRSNGGINDYTANLASASCTVRF